MSDVLPIEDAAQSRKKSSLATTAGSLLRQARQAQGLHIASLAASIKVTPLKLEQLEADQYDQLPDATFTRALAHAVCRSLKVDPVPILAMLPPPNEHRLEEVAEGLNMPFNERPGRLVPKEWMSLSSPAMWIAALLVLGAAIVYFMPVGWLAVLHSGPARAVSDVSAVVAPVSETIPSGAQPLVTVVPSSSASAASVAASAISAIPATAVLSLAASAATTTGLLQLRTSAQTWVDVTDATGKSLIGRLLKPGESVGLDGVVPLKVTIGNATATRLVFRGQPQELSSSTRDNVARLELK